MPLEKKSKQQTYYNIDWEDPNLHPDLAKWICKGKDNTLFSCKVCNNWNLMLGKSGIAAPTHHMKPSKEPGKKTKHERMMTAVSKTSSLAACLTSSTMTKEPSTSSITEENLQPSLQVSTSKKNFFPSQHVTKAEVLLAMKSVTSHISSRGMDEFPDLLRLMLPDSEIAKDIHIHRTKFRYVISHGLAPYFKERFMGIIKDALRFTVCFDESLNKTCSCRKQLDVHVICLDENDFLVKRFYIGSAFIGHGDADSCLESLLGVLGELDYVHKLVQIGMDGPNVNWKLHSMLKEKRLLKDPQSPNLLEIGSCSTHVLHGAYNTAQSATDWGLAKFLKSCHSIFKDSPARRSDYLAANNLDTAHEGKDTSYLFPLKFCGHRWLENVKCLNRVVEIIPYLTVYFNFLVREKKMPKNDERFEGIKTFLSKPHAPAILQFSLCIMRDFEPYLELFQAERPLAFFLFQKLKVLLNSLLCKFVRPEVIKNSVIRKLMQLDFKDSSKLLPDSSVDVGFGAKGSLKKLKTTESTYAHVSFKEMQSSFLCHF